MSFLDDLVRPELADVRPYLPTQGDFRVRLDANEAPGPLEPRLRERLASAFGELALERYPDATAKKLREAVAERLGVEPNELLMGVGSDEILALLVTALAKPRRGSEPPIVLTTSPTFVMYKMSARLRGLRVIEVPLDASWDLAEEGMLRALEIGPPHLVFIASPNNPTGTLMDRTRLERVIRAASRSLVVIDEAYIDYATAPGVGTVMKLALDLPDVFVTRTFSKAYGMAGMRMGYAIGQPETLRKLSNAWGLGDISELQAVGGIAALADQEHMAWEKQENKRIRDYTTGEFQKMGFQVADSQTNFIFVNIGRPAAGFRDACRELGVAVGRDFPPMEKTWARISLGRMEDMEKAVPVFKRVLGKA